LQAENERLRFDLQGIHSCHANCTRDACVNRRLREKLKVAEEFMQFVWRDVSLNDYAQERLDEALAKIRGER